MTVQRVIVIVNNNTGVAAKHHNKMRQVTIWIHLTELVISYCLLFCCRVYRGTFATFTSGLDPKGSAPRLLLTERFRHYVTTFLLSHRPEVLEHPVGYRMEASGAEHVETSLWTTCSLCSLMRLKLFVGDVLLNTFQIDLRTCRLWCFTRGWSVPWFMQNPCISTACSPVLSPWEDAAPLFQVGFQTGTLNWQYFDILYSSVYSRKLGGKMWWPGPV